MADIEDAKFKDIPKKHDPLMVSDTLGNLKVGDHIFLQYPHERDELPDNVFCTKTIEPVEVVSLPTKSEKRFYVKSDWRENTYFFESGERIMTEDPFVKFLKKAEA